MLSFEKARIENTNTWLATLLPERTNQKEKPSKTCSPGQKPHRGVFVGLSIAFSITYFVQIHNTPFFLFLISIIILQFPLYLHVRTYYSSYMERFLIK